MEGPAGSGKTTRATRYLLSLLEAEIAPDRILVLVPQATYGRPYQLAVHHSKMAGGMVDIQTLAGIARRAIETYWPIIAAPMGFAMPEREPIFLNIETAQYYMARVATPMLIGGSFDGVKMAQPRIISQVLDNLHKAAILRFPVDEVAQRLTMAWGERHSSRPPVYTAAAELAAQFRSYCLEHNLLDFSLIVETFDKVLRHDTNFSKRFLGSYDFLIADNIEEDNPAAHDFIRWLLPHTIGSLLIYDTDGGYRIFLGADPDTAHDLAQICTQRETVTTLNYSQPSMLALGDEFNRSLGPTLTPPDQLSSGDALAAFQYEFHHYYPQMVEWTANKIIALVKEQHIEPHQIAVLAPYLSDSLRFGLSYRLNAAGIATRTHRPSRALHDEPVTRAMLTLTALAQPTWAASSPAMADVADALSQTIVGLDPVRARLLASIIYRPASGELSAFTQINADMQMRITYVAGERFDALRQWLANARSQLGTAPLDHFLRRLFGEILSQPGYGYHTDLDAGRVTGQLVASAQRFRQTLYPDTTPDWTQAAQEYLSLLDQRFLSALHVQSWQDEETNAVFLAPAFTFLMRNRVVDYQFWLDVGSDAWWERLEQPLTHPYVLRRDYPADLPWTDDMESEAQTGLLYKIMMGLTRRCRQQIYLGITALGEEGFEQRGPLLRVFQQILRRHLPDLPANALGDEEVA
ncbi:MAG: UvrD-helicase domain-containing protein [Chloroflexota bacterium]